MREEVIALIRAEGIPFEEEVKWSNAKPHRGDRYISFTVGRSVREIHLHNYSVDHLLVKRISDEEHLRKHYKASARFRILPRDQPTVAVREAVLLCLRALK
jgi:hypothetical protein